MARGKKKHIRTPTAMTGVKGGRGGRTRSQKIRDYVDSAQTGEKPKKRKPKRKPKRKY